MSSEKSCAAARKRCRRRADDSVKYGLSVTGTVHPDRIWQNNTGRVGDLLILTKPLGTGILCAAHRVGEENPGGFQKAVESMMTLNKYASETEV